MIEFWKSKNIDCAGLYQRDGSGLSARNVISSKILTEILVTIHKENLL
ncbi:MAG: D-alanyl-D-alanine carboxypeptidase [Flammeovirgaceae bacterium]